MRFKSTLDFVKLIDDYIKQMPNKIFIQKTTLLEVLQLKVTGYRVDLRHITDIQLRRD